MKIREYRHRFVSDADEREALIEVYPRTAPISDLMRQSREEWGASFVNDLPNQFDSEGRLLPLTIASDGREAPARARELWKIPGGDYFTTIFLAVHTLRRPVKSQSADYLGERDYHRGELLKFLSNPRFSGVLTLDYSMLHWLTFSIRKGAPLKEIIDEFIDYGSTSFGAYSSKLESRRWRSSYARFREISLGYVAMEPGH